MHLGSALYLLAIEIHMVMVVIGVQESQPIFGDSQMMVMDPLALGWTVVVMLHTK